jgi:hypothetical protein
MKKKLGEMERRGGRPFWLYFYELYVLFTRLKVLTNEKSGGENIYRRKPRDLAPADFGRRG